MKVGVDVQGSPSLMVRTICGRKATLNLNLESVEIKPLTKKHYSSALTHFEISGKHQTVCS